MCGGSEPEVGIFLAVLLRRLGHRVRLGEGEGSPRQLAEGKTGLLGQRGVLAPGVLRWCSSSVLGPGAPGSRLQGFWFWRAAGFRVQHGKHTAGKVVKVAGPGAVLGRVAVTLETAKGGLKNFLGRSSCQS